MGRPSLIHIQTIAIRLRMKRVVVCRIRIDSQLVRRSDGVLELVPGDAFSEVSVTGTNSLVPYSTAAMHTCFIGEIGGCRTLGICLPVAWLVVEGRAVGVNVVVGPVCWLGGCVALFVDVSGEKSFPALRRLLGPFLELALGGLEAFLVLFRHGERLCNLVKLAVGGGILRVYGWMLCERRNSGRTRGFYVKHHLLTSLSDDAEYDTGAICTPSSCSHYSTNTASYEARSPYLGSIDKRLRSHS